MPASRDMLGALLTSPQTNLLRMAALAALAGGELEEELQDSLREQVARGVLAELSPHDAWPELARGMMGERPSRMLWALRESGALAVVLPELDALFGMPQADRNGELVDLGAHALAVADGLARQQAPLGVRFAGLMYNLGKADSPPEHLPTHYKHIERALPRIGLVCARFGVDDGFYDLAVLALHELERVHKATEMRAGALAALLARCEAFTRPQRFRHLLGLCRADYLAFPSSRGEAYPKAPMLETALLACLELDASGLQGEALLEARAVAIATALRSVRWSQDAA